MWQNMNFPSIQIIRCPFYRILCFFVFYHLICSASANAQNSAAQPYPYSCIDPRFSVLHKGLSLGCNPAIPPTHVYTKHKESNPHTSFLSRQVKLQQVIHVPRYMSSYKMVSPNDVDDCLRYQSNLIGRRSAVMWYDKLIPPLQLYLKGVQRFGLQKAHRDGWRECQFLRVDLTAF